MKTIKVSEATNLQLGWLVAICEGKRVSYCGAGPSAYLAYIPKRSAYKVWSPTTNPIQMWPIIEREGIDVFTSYEGSRIEGSFAEKTGWAARRHTYGGPINPKRFLGRTSLIAAARCYVASKLGETVEVPEELT